MATPAKWWEADELIAPAPKATSSLLRRAVADPLVALGQGAVDLGESAVGIGSLLSGGAVGRGAQALGYDPERTRQAIGEWYSPEAKTAFEAVEQAEGVLPTLQAVAEHPSSALLYGVRSLPFMGGTVAAARGAAGLVGQGARATSAARTAAGVAEGALTAGNIAEEIRRERPGDVAAMYQGAVPAGIGTALIGRLGGALEAGLATRGMPGASGLAGGLPARVLKAAATEAAEESAQSAQERAWTNLALDRPWDQGVAKEAALGGVVGGLLGGAMGPFAGGGEMAQASAPPAMAPVIPPAAAPAADLIQGTEGQDTLQGGLVSAAIRDATRAPPASEGPRVPPELLFTGRVPYARAEEATPPPPEPIGPLTRALTLGPTSAGAHMAAMGQPLPSPLGRRGENLSPEPSHLERLMAGRADERAVEAERRGLPRGQVEELPAPEALEIASAPTPGREALSTAGLTVGTATPEAYAAAEAALRAREQAELPRPEVEGRMPKRGVLALEQMRQYLEGQGAPIEELTAAPPPPTALGGRASRAEAWPGGTEERVDYPVLLGDERPAVPPWNLGQVQGGGPVESLPAVQRATGAPVPVAPAVQPPAAFTEREQSPKPERRRQTRQTTPTEVDWGAVERLSQTAESREDLRRQGFISSGKAQDLDAYGYRIVYWSSPRLKKAGDPHYGVIEYRPLGHGKGPQPPRLTARTAEQQAAVHRALGLPLGEARQLALPPGKFAPRATYAGPPAASPVIPAAEMGRVPATPAPEPAAPEPAPAEAARPAPPTRKADYDELRENLRRAGEDPSGLAAWAYLQIARYAPTQGFTVQDLVRRYRSNRKSGRKNPYVSAEVPDAVLRLADANLLRRRWDAEGNAYYTAARPFTREEEVPSDAESLRSDARPVRRDDGPRPGADEGGQDLQRSGEGEGPAAGRPEGERAPEVGSPSAGPGPVAPKKTAKQRYAERKRIDPAKDDLLSAIAKSGGIAVEEARAQGIDPAEFRRRGWGVLPVFSKAGDSFDGMAERLSQFGYLSPAYTANELLDKIDLALRGQRVVAAAGVEVQAEAALAEYEADQLAAWEAEQDAPFLLDEAQYLDNHDAGTRTLSDLAQEAIDAGADEDAVADLIERGALQGRADEDIARDLRALATRLADHDAGAGGRDPAPAGVQQGARPGQAEAEDLASPPRRQQADFVGGKTAQDQVLHDARLARDAARNRDYVPPSEGPGDLFAGPRAVQQRMDLATAPPQAAAATPPTEAGPAPASPSPEADDEILFSRRGDRIQDYRLDDYDALPPAIKAVVDRVLAEDEDPQALRQRLRELKGTPWATQALDGALARAAVREAMGGREPSWRSALEGSALKAALQRRGEAALWDYLQSYGVLGNPAKPRLAIASSFLNCHPNRGCAEICYATGGNYYAETHILKGELIELAVRLDPRRAGRMAAQQYKAAHGLWDTEALRLFDKGDGAPHWLPFVAALNRAGVRVHVFSKRPEFLRQLSDFNLRLLSVDGSRWREALKHPDLRPAFLYRGREDNDAVVALAQAARSEATLPMVLPIQRQGASTKAAMQEWRGLPQPLHRLVCPVDSGKAVRLGTGPGEYSCRRCDKGLGVGCYFHATTAQARAAVDAILAREHAVAMDPGLLELHSALKELEREAEKHLNGDRAQSLADAVRALLADARRGTLPDAAGGVAETLRGADEALGGGGGEERRSSGGAREGAAPAYGFRLTDDPGPDADAVEEGRGRLELYDAPSASPRKKGQIQLATRVKQIRIGTFRSPLTKVEGVYDAAVLLRDLGLGAQEQMMALVVDKDDRPLSVIRHSVGTIDGSQVYPGVLAGAIHAVRGASRVYLAHNHPSGVEDLSHADHNIAQRIAQILWDTGVTIEGFFTVTTEGRAHDWNGGRFDVSALDAAPRAGARVPVTERQYARFGTLGPQVSDPASGKDAVRRIGGDESGVLLLNNRHHPVGWVPLAVGDMQKLRTGSTRSGASRLFRAISEANAAAAILSLPEITWSEIAGSGDARRGASNLHRFLKQADIRVLDTIYAGGAESAAEAGLQFPDSDPYFQRGAPGPGLSVAQARAVAERLTRHLASAPTVHILADASDPALPPAVAQRMAREDIAARAFLYQGEVYLFARELRDEADLVKTLVDHEFRHYGLRGVLGKRLTPVLEAAWRGAEHAQIRAFARDQGIDTSTARGQREAAEEYIVHLAESGQENTLLQRVFAAIREWLRRIGFDLALTDLDLRRLVAAAGTFVESGKRLPLAGLVYQSQRTSGTYGPGPAPTSPGSGAPTEPRVPPRAGRPRPAAFARRAPWYFSAAGRSAAELPMRKATGAQWLAMLRKAPGVKPEELDWLGLPQWLEGQKSVTKEALLDFVAQHQIRVEEVLKNEQLAERQVSRYERRRRETEEALAQYLRQDGALTPEQRYRTLEAVADRAQPLELVASDAQVPLTDDFRRLAEALRSAVIESEDNVFNSRSVPTAKPRFGRGHLVVPGGSDYTELLLTLPQSYVQRRFQETTPAPRGRGYHVKRASNGQTWDLLNPRGDLVERFASRDDAELLGDLKNKEWRAARATPFRSDHWSEKNILAHVRFDTRTDADGKRVLFLNELQSDWHQSAQRMGGMTFVGYQSQFRVGEPREEVVGALEVKRTVYPVIGPKGEYGTYPSRADAERRVEFDRNHAVPDAPFKTSWPLLAVKRMLRWAVDHGYDRLAWAPAAVHIKRYNKDRFVHALHWKRAEDGYQIVEVDASGRKAPTPYQQPLSLQEVARLYGPDVAERLEAQKSDWGTVPSYNRRIGGEWYKGMYDKTLPFELGKYVKRWGASVGQTDIPYRGTDSGTVRAWSVDLTDAMRESVAEGQPLFARKPKDPWTLPLAEAEWRARVLGPRVAAAYEAGDWHAAETLDAQLEALYDRLEHGYGQLEGELEEGADREQERIEGFADEEDDNLEADLASYYHSLYVAKDGRIVPSDLLYVAKPTPAQVDRANAATLREVLADYGWKLGGLKPEVSDEQVVAAARDAYEARARRGVSQGLAARRAQADARRALFRAAGARVIEGPQAPDLRFARTLDMRPAARIARARALGFDTDHTYYHATSYDFRAFDPAYTGLGTHLGTREQARDIGGTHVLPVWIRKASDDQIAQVTDVGDWTDFASVVESLDDDGRLTDADVAELNRLPWYSKARMEALRQLLLRKGIRQLRYENQHEGGDEAVSETVFRQGGGESVLVLDPADLRSVFAAFDPERAEDSDLLFARRPASTGNPDLDSALAKAGIAPDARTPIERTVDAVRDWWGATRTDLKDRILEGTFDQFHGIQTAERRVAGNLPAEQSGYVAARLSTGTSAVLYAMLHWGAPRWGRNALEPVPGSKGLLEVLAPVRDDLRGFFGWMIGRRARRLLQEDREHLFTPDEIAALESLHKPAYDRVAEDFAAYKRAVLDLAEGAGLVNPATRAAWDHADWIPFYRLTEADRVQGPHGRRGLSHQSSGIRTLQGGREALGDPLENLVLSFAHLVDASLKNHALRQTVTNLLAEPNGVLEPLPTSEFTRALVPRSEVKRVLREAGVEPEVLELLPPEAFGGIAQLWSLRAPKDPDVVRVMDAGKARYFRVHDAALLRGLTAVNQEALGGLVKPLRAFKRLLTAAVTADPAFMLRNFVRDALHAWTISEHAFRPGVDSVRGALKTLREAGGLRDMMFAGASFMGGYVNAGDSGEVARSIRRALRARGYDAAAEDRFLATLIDSPARFWEKYRSVGDAIENANREATFEATLRATGSTTEAAYQAKDLMDYSMRGNWTLFRLMGDVLPFFNARLQGLYKLGRAGALTRPQVLARGALIALFSLALLALNRDNDEYEALEEWDKDANWHFWLPDGAGGTKHVRLPKPFEIGLLYGTVPERVARNLLGRDDTRTSFERLLWAVRDTLAFDPVPQAVKPIAELYANRDSFTGRPIEGLADAGKRPFARYDETTSASMRALGGLTSEATGVSPKQLEHLWRGYLGALGAYALEAADIAVRWAEGGPPRAARRWDEVPVVKAFVRESPAFSTRYRTELYEMAREAEQLYRTVRALREEGRAEEARALAEANSEKLKARAGLRRATEAMSQIRAQMDRVQRAADLTAEEKRARLDTLIGRRNEIAKAAVERAGVGFRG